LKQYTNGLIGCSEKGMPKSASHNYSAIEAKTGL